MALTPGTRLGPYDITAQIGAGGMGEVYRATDSNLKRQVAIKVLPASVAADVTEKHSSFSPNGRWISYMATTSVGGATGSEIFVQPYPPTGAKYQVSNGGGRAAVWTLDGKQLVFHSAAINQFLVVDVGADKNLTFGTPTPFEASEHDSSRLAAQL